MNEIVVTGNCFRCEICSDEVLTLKLATDPSGVWQVVVAADAGPPRVESWPYPRSPRDVSLLDLDAAAGYVAALAVLGPCPAVTPRDGSALLAGLA